jgi:MFS family permease
MVIVLELANDVSVHTPVVLAIVPILLYTASCFSSLSISSLSVRIGRKTVYGIGTLFFMICCVFMMGINKQTNWLIFILAPLLGVAQSMTFNIGLNYIVSDSF